MRRVTIAILAAALVSATASGSAANQIGLLIHGRHNVLRAGMYATLLDEYPDHPFQILDQLCPKPNSELRCEPVSNALRRAIDDTVSVSFRWVHREQPDGGHFWTLAPVVRDGGDATFLYRVEKPGSNCRGHGELRFRRIDWTGWVWEGGTGQVTCSVSS